MLDQCVLQKNSHPLFETANKTWHRNPVLCEDLEMFYFQIFSIQSDWASAILEREVDKKKNLFQKYCLRGMNTSAHHTYQIFGFLNAKCLENYFPLFFGLIVMHRYVFLYRFF